MSSRDLAIIEPPKGSRARYRFTLRRNGKKPWTELQWRHKDRRITLRAPETMSLANSLAAFNERVPWFERFVRPRKRQKTITVLSLNGEQKPVLHSQRFPVTPCLEDGEIWLKTAPLQLMQQRLNQFVADATLQAMETHTREMAAKLGMAPGRIWLSPAQRKWGACDRHNNVNYSWRLAMAPPEVQRYLAAHEVAHFKHKHHRQSFWEEVNTLMPDWPAPEHWLSFCGGELMGVSLNTLVPQSADEPQLL
ncbi:MAG: YgjP-like metallopeptidase domain-containing protein [Pseudomonadota bacterium]